MKVTYDVSVLAESRKHPRARTGIYRVVERVACGLAASPECELTLSAAASPHAFDQATRYLRAHPRLRRTPVLSPGGNVPAARGLYSLARVLQRQGEFKRAGRFAWKILFHGARLVGGKLRRADSGTSSRAEVFHSPFAALPEAAAGPGAVRRFLTVYDLITVRFPHFFDQGLVHQMEQVYASLGPEDWAMAISESTKADLCEYRGIAPARVFVTPLAADPELFYPCRDSEQVAAVRQKYGIPEGRYVLSLNTLEPRKNMDHAIRAFVELVEQEQLRDLSFVLVGAKGWKYEKIFEAIRGVGPLRERIVLPGYVADEDLAALYSGAMAFVYPSLYEGFGLPPLEAMQCGVPVIASNTSSLPEVVGDAGALLDPADREGLSQSLLELYRSPELRTRMRAQSLARASLFSWERCIQQTLAAYRTALAS